jgi:hypothetical protein
LAAYYQPLGPSGSGFTGGQFDTFDPTGARQLASCEFTADDLVAVTFLSVRVPPRAAFDLLIRRRGHFATLLEELGPDRDFALLPDVSEEAFRPAWLLWRALIDVVGLGPTTVSKLMARKRPRLIPIFDSVINEHVLQGSGKHWITLHDALNREHADGLSLHDYLQSLGEAADLGPAVSAIRIFDVLAWMDGTGQSDRVLELSS